MSQDHFLIAESKEGIRRIETCLKDAAASVKGLLLAELQMISAKKKKMIADYNPLCEIGPHESPLGRNKLMNKLKV
jgi:hypothetical protein